MSDFERRLSFYMTLAIWVHVTRDNFLIMAVGFLLAGGAAAIHTRQAQKASTSR